MRRIIFLATILCMLCPITMVGPAQTEKPIEAQAASAILPIDPSKGGFLDIVSQSSNLSVDDLKVETVSDSFMGRSVAKATVNIKNLTKEHLQVSVFLVLYDEAKNVVACGNYSSSGTFGGFKPRVASNETILLGYAPDLNRSKFYQYRITSYLEPPVQ